MVLVTDLAGYQQPRLAPDQTFIVVCTELPSREELLAIWRRGVVGCYVLPTEHAAFLEAVTQAKGSVALARELKTLRARFLSLLVHDLRNPLATAQVNLELLRRGLAPEEQAETVSDALLSVEGALAILRDVTEINRAENQGFQYSRSVGAIDQLLASVIDRQGAAAALRQVMLVTQIAPPLTSEFDGEPLGRALNHVLNSSIRHARVRGQVVVSATTRDNEILIAIDNDGAPIPRETRPKLFARYGADGEGRTSRGIGFYLARLVIEHHGGSIRATESTIGGARFEITLPRVAES